MNIPFNLYCSSGTSYPCVGYDMTETWNGCVILNEIGIAPHIDDGWSKQEVWIIAEHGVDICSGSCFIDIDIRVNGELLEADGAEGITIS